MEENQEIPIPTRFFSLSRKYALVAVITTVLVGIVLVLVLALMLSTFAACAAASTRLFEW